MSLCSDGQPRRHPHAAATAAEPRGVAGHRLRVARRRRRAALLLGAAEARAAEEKLRAEAAAERAEAAAERAEAAKAARKKFLARNPDG